MRAALAEEFGGVDSVRLGDRPEPVAGAGQVLVRVRCAGVGPWDVGFLDGGFPGVTPPSVPGQEVAGVVEAAGEGAGVRPGDQVYGSLFPAGGGFAELALASAERVAPMPGRASFAEAAGLVIGAGTAHEGLIDRGRLRAGETVLIDGADGQTRDQAVSAVRDGGRAVFIVLQGPPAPLERGITGEPFAARVTRPRLEALNRLVDAGALRPQVSAELPLDQAREALAQVAARHARGKIVLRVGR